MSATVRIVINEQSQVAEARRTARKLAGSLGFDDEVQEQVAIVTTEASTNILKYAGEGEVLVTPGEAGPGEKTASLDVIAIDRGPGIRSFARCLRDGYTTGSSPGNGMGSIVRLSAASDFYSEHDKGVALLARWHALGYREEAGNGTGLRVGAVNVPKPGQEVCGDSWGQARIGEQTYLMLADGLGHGYDAQTASLAAVRILYDHLTLSPKELLEYAHVALRGTRGAAVAAARIDPVRREVVFAGVGNIAAQICSDSSKPQHLVSVNGTVGHESQKFREFVYPWPDHGTLILFSDGLSSGTGFSAYPGLILRDPALVAGVFYRDFSRGHDDATAVVAGGASSS